jgi:molybdopterin synthase sulfur carrier subunit
MPTVSFTPNIQRHVTCPTARVEGGTVREALDAVFRGNPRARAYVLDEQGAVRPHMVVFVNGRQVRDRQRLSDPVPRDGDIYVAQALSGG